ncbi:ATP synthase F1 subunit delta [Myxococcota bacterium]|nr:ATP synthase F1 subunit delta [Myxococcota bacterium]
MRSSAAARRYARALFSLAEESASVESVRSELEAMMALFEGSPELADSLFRPLHPVAERRAVLQAVCERVGSSETLRNYYAFLVDQRRLVDFPAICEEFSRLADLAAGRTQAQVVTANPLSPEQQDRLRDALAARTGQQVELELTVDPSLLGGAIATVGGVVFDGSLRTQLTQMRTALTRGN